MKRVAFIKNAIGTRKEQALVQAIEGNHTGLTAILMMISTRRATSWRWIVWYLQLLIARADSHSHRSGVRSRVG